MDRESILDKVKNLSKSNPNIILQFATGTGKSKCALSLIDYWQAKKILLCVAETAHKTNWKKEFIKWKVDIPDNLVIITYQSLHKYENTSWDLIIFDEAHHLNTDKRLMILSTLKANNIVALSATLTDDCKNALNTSTKKRFYVYTITLKDAIENDILPSPELKIVPLTLNNTIRSQSYDITYGNSSIKKVFECNYPNRWDYMAKAFKLKNPNSKIIVRCTEFEKYTIIDEKCNYYKRMYNNMHSDRYLQSMLRAGLERKRYLGDLKTEAVRSILSTLTKKKTICFCSSIIQAMCINDKCAIYSGKPNSQYLIDKFDKGEIKQLLMVNMLKEGQNLNNVEASIITQLDGTTLAFIQKVGRVLRAIDPIQYILYYKNTRDEEYLEKALQNF